MGIDQQDSFAETVFYGCLSGTISVLAGHPLDTLKVRFQTGQTKHVLRNLYSGVGPALMSTPINWITCVTMFGSFLRQLDVDTTRNHAIAGSLTGATLGVFMSPIQLLKCNAQVQKHSSWAVCKRLANDHGWRILRRGMALTVAVDVVGLAAYFGSYHYFKQTLPSYNLPEQITSGLAGGFAGCICWGSVFPLDTMKSRWQTDLKLKRISQTWKTSLYRGFWFSQARAFWVNSVVWFAVDEAKKLVQTQKGQTYKSPTRQTQPVVPAFNLWQQPTLDFQD